MKNLPKITDCMQCAAVLNLFYHSVWHGSEHLTICDPLCEIQAKVSIFNYEKTSIKV